MPVNVGHYNIITGSGQHIPKHDFHDWNLIASSASSCLVSPCIRYWRLVGEYPSKFNFTEKSDSINDGLVQHEYYSLTAAGCELMRIFVYSTTHLFLPEIGRPASGKIYDSSFRLAADALLGSGLRNNSVS